ncbi:MAG: 1-acyl-sn-glycerol-3-phosphate acyltransferase [Pseudomonadota bacterium]
MNDNDTAIRALEKIAIHGEAPMRDAERSLVFIAKARSDLERSLLEAFAESRGATHNGPVRIAWITVDDRDDTVSHQGLDKALMGDGNQLLPADALLVPLGVIWQTREKRAGSRPRLRDLVIRERTLKREGRQRRFLEKTPEQVGVVVGEAGSVGALKTRFDNTRHISNETAEFADFVARQAALTIERDARKYDPSLIKFPRFVADALWSRREFQERLAELASSSGRSIEDVQSEARSCMRELIPRVNPFYVELSNVIWRTARRLGYEEDIVLDADAVEKLRQKACTTPLALVFTHKSHVDGVAVINATHDHGFPLVHIIGGNNMAFFGVGHIMRRAGAIFIRRSTKDSDVYKAVLRSYLGYLLEKRFPVAWSLEGTRSRNGKLMPPRFGILKYVVEAAAKTAASNLNVVPVSIYYDLIAELDDYAYEQKGGVKRPESFAWFTKYLRSLRNPLGRLSMAFGSPVIVDASSKEFAAMTADTGDRFSIELQKLAFRASVSANAVTPLTPTAVFALVLSAAAPSALTEREIIDDFTDIVKWAGRRRIPMTDDLKTGDEARIAKVAEAMMQVGVVTRYDEGLEPLFSIAQDQEFAAAYYRNSVVHFFVNKAICELALAKAIEAPSDHTYDIFRNETIRLRDIFKFEFFYPTLDDHLAEFEREMALVDRHWKKTLANDGAYALLQQMSPFMSHATLRPFAEAYSVVADAVMNLKADDDSSEKALVATALKRGKQAVLRRQVTNSDAVGKLMFSNAYKLAENRKLITGATDLTGARVAFARELKDIARRLRLISALSAQARAETDIGVRGVVSDRVEALASDPAMAQKPQPRTA